MDGRATFTIVASRTIISIPAQSTAIASQRELLPNPTVMDCVSSEVIGPVRGPYSPVEPGPANSTSGPSLLQVHAERNHADAGLAHQHRGGLLGIEDRAGEVVDPSPDAADAAAAQVGAAQPRAVEHGAREVAFRQHRAHQLGAHEGGLGELAALEAHVLEPAVVPLQGARLAVPQADVHAAAFPQPGAGEPAALQDDLR